MSTELNALQLEELHDDLNKLLQQLSKQLEGDESSNPVVLDQQLVGRVSRIDAIQQQQMAKANRQQAISQLIRIEKALLTFSEGEYGYCQNCDEVINFLRLKACPDTPFCVSCQSKIERSGSSR